MRSKKAIIIISIIFLVIISISLAALVLSKDANINNTNTLNIVFKDKTNELKSNNKYEFSVIGTYKEKYKIELNTELDDLNIILRNKTGLEKLNKNIKDLEIDKKTNNYILYIDYIIDSNQVNDYIIEFNSKKDNTIKMLIETE